MFKRLAYIAMFLVLFHLGYGQRYTLSGYVKEKGSGELLIGATIYAPAVEIGAVSNTYGFYSLTLPAGAYDIIISSVGYLPKKENVDLNQDITLHVSIEAFTQELSEVEIRSSQADFESEKVQMSKIGVTSKTIQDLPALLGEKDVLRVLQLLPGVQSGGEFSGGLYVRGGGPDQNLIILDDAIVYNANHLGGLFSVFNGDAVKDTQLYKGGFPARYGGRLSSIIEVNMKEGNKESYHGKIGVGILSSQLVLEGPIRKGSTSFLVSGRRSYLDVFTRTLLPQGSPNYVFFDLNMKLNHEFSDKDKLYLSAYTGRDAFFATLEDPLVETDFGFSWGNVTSTARWNHQWGKKLFSNTSFIFSDYQVRVSVETIQRILGVDQTTGIELNSSITNYTLKYDMDYIPNSRHYVRYGGVATLYRFNPNAFRSRFPTDNSGTASSGDVDNANPYFVQDAAAYIEDDVKITTRLSGNLGFRFSGFNHENTQYGGIEPRLAFAYKLVDYLSLKASYTYMRQYIHLLGSTAATLPTDLWVSSTSRVPPKNAHQWATGLSKDFPDLGLSFTLEGYYKRSTGVIAYREGAVLVNGNRGLPDNNDNVSWDTQVVHDIAGDSYGGEILLRKQRGAFTGWVGYTLAQTVYQSPSLNNNEAFFPRHDRRHDVSVALTYEPIKSWTISAVWVYGTGVNYTVPRYGSTIFALKTSPEVGNVRDIGNFRSFGDLVNVNVQRLNFRGEAYHRLDLGAQYHVTTARGNKRTLEVSAYNAYNRLNPFTYLTGSSANTSQFTLTRIGLFPIIPSVSFKYEF